MRLTLLRNFMDPASQAKFRVSLLNATFPMPIYMTDVAEKGMDGFGMSYSEPLNKADRNGATCDRVKHVVLDGAWTGKSGKVLLSKSWNEGREVREDAFLPATWLHWSVDSSRSKFSIC